MGILLLKKISHKKYYFYNAWAASYASLRPIVFQADVDFGETILSREFPDSVSVGAADEIYRVVLLVLAYDRNCRISCREPGCSKK